MKLYFINNKYYDIPAIDAYNTQRINMGLPTIHFNSVDIEVPQDIHDACALDIVDGAFSETIYLARKQKKYEDCVETLIREKYSINQELATLRQRDTKPEEFAEYNRYAEYCKALAKIKTN